MSIIHEALKKADQGQVGLKNAMSSPTPIQIKKAGQPTIKGGLAFIVTLLVGIGMFMMGYLSRIDKQLKQANAASERPGIHHSMPKPTTPGVTGQFAIEEIPTARGFAASGVVIGQGYSYGIINGKIVEKGQTVSGATVESITDKEIVLSYQGETVAVPVSTNR